MTSHIALMVTFAACVATVFATVMRGTPNAQLRMGIRVFGGLVLGAYVIGWVMFGLFG